MIVQTPAREAPDAPPLSQPDPSGKDQPFPAVIGQNNHADGSRERQFTLTITEADGSQRIKLLSAPDFVTPTGGGYFFAPSIAALANKLS